MSTRRRLLVAGVALVAMIVPLAASAAPPAGRAGRSRVARNARGWGRLGQHDRSRRRAVRTPAGDRRDLARDPKSGKKTLYASGLPRRFVGSRSAASWTSRSSARPRTPSSASSAPIRTTWFGICNPATPSGSTAWTDPRPRPSSLTSARWPCANPPSGFPIVVATGVQYALETYRGGFLVTDGHHNRVLRVTLDGTITQLIAFGDVVPTGLAVSREHDLPR